MSVAGRSELRLTALSRQRVPRSYRDLHSSTPSLSDFCIINLTFSSKKSNWQVTWYQITFCGKHEYLPTSSARCPCRIQQTVCDTITSGSVPGHLDTRSRQLWSDERRARAQAGDARTDSGVTCRSVYSYQRKSTPRAIYPQFLHKLQLSSQSSVIEIICISLE